MLRVEIKYPSAFSRWTFRTPRKIICIFICNFPHRFKFCFRWALSIINIRLYFMSIFFCKWCYLIHFINRVCRMRFRYSFCFFLHLLIVKEYSFLLWQLMHLHLPGWHYLSARVLAIDTAHWLHTSQFSFRSTPSKWCRFTGGPL